MYIRRIEISLETNLEWPTDKNSAHVKRVCWVNDCLAALPSNENGLAYKDDVLSLEFHIVKICLPVILVKYWSNSEINAKTELH